MASEMGPTVCRRGGLVQYSGHGEWRDVMTAVSGRGADVMTPVSERRVHVLVEDVMTVVSERGAHVHLLEAATVMLLVRALLLVILFLLKKVMQEVVQVKALLV